MKTLLRTLYVVMGIVTLGILILLVGSIFPVAGFQTKIVTSGSMEPSIQTGSMVVVRSSDAYAEGDVITFYERGKEELPTTHRIIGTDLVSGQVRFITKGDANDDPDSQPVSMSQVIGKVLAVAPGFGYLLSFARSWQGLLLLVGVPFALVAIEEWRKIKKVIRA
jgi:signal peptidase